MLTGDKMENAEHVARSCKMIWPQTKPLYLTGRDNLETALTNMLEEIEHLKQIDK